jgi:hypothetical protein
MPASLQQREFGVPGIGQDAVIEFEQAEEPLM